MNSKLQYGLAIGLAVVALIFLYFDQQGPGLFCFAIAVVIACWKPRSDNFNFI